MSGIGSIICVGIGIKLGAHLTPIAKSHIESADVCFVAAADSLFELWVKELHPDVRSLQPVYQQNSSRKDTYKQMANLVLDEVRKGKRVCGIFYGHPGVFAQVPHKIISQAKLEGYSAFMEPGISAEDCLVADLGIDPGQFGCQQYEATQFIKYKRVIDPSAYLILWQIGVVGDLGYGTEVTTAAHRKVLLDELYKIYPENHKVILYEAATSAISKLRKDEVTLTDLESVLLKDYTTLVIPPARKMIRNKSIIEKLERINRI